MEKNKPKASTLKKVTGQARASYHHGALRLALIEAADQLLEEHGIEAFSLREVARRVGVSSAAPAHHFQDAAGLLTEVAILGFTELSRYLDEWDRKGGTDPRARLHSQGHGYIRFALVYSARFQLMFRKEKLRESDSLRSAAEKAFSYLKRAVYAELQIAENDTSQEALATVLLAWSTVHGFAHLALDGQFDRMSHPKGIQAFCDLYVPLMFKQIVPGKNRQADAQSSLDKN